MRIVDVHLSNGRAVERECFYGWTHMGWRQEEKKRQTFCAWKALFSSESANSPAETDPYGPGVAIMNLSIKSTISLRRPRADF